MNGRAEREPVRWRRRGQVKAWLEGLGAWLLLGAWAWWMIAEGIRR